MFLSFPTLLLKLSTAVKCSIREGEGGGGEDFFWKGFIGVVVDWKLKTGGKGGGRGGAKILCGKGL